MSKTLTILILSIFLSQSASANGWSWNLGYHNPAGSTYGLNFMHLWSNWAFEIGVGGVRSDENDNSNTTTVSAYGGMSVKYLFGSNWFRPYLQLGTSTAAQVSGGENTNAGAATGGGSYAGAGIFLMGNPFYIYASINDHPDGFTQFGLGFDF